MRNIFYHHFRKKAIIKINSPGKQWKFIQEQDIIKPDTFRQEYDGSYWKYYEHEQTWGG